MAKKGKKTKGKETKGKTGKVPKEIAGIKLPKELRKAVAPIVEWAERNPLVTDAIAAALLAGATALADNKGTKKAAKAAGAGAGAAAAAVKAGKGSERIGLALAVAAGEIATRLFAESRAQGQEDKGEEDRPSRDEGEPSGGALGTDGALH
jgi:hypothetical protein